MTVYIHIGLHKTGTSSIQSFLNTNRHVFEDGGIAIPAAGWLEGAHHNIPLQILGKPKFAPANGGLAEALPQIDARPHALLSSEEFEFLDLAGVKKLKRGLGDRPARVVVYLCRQDALIASTYAQQIKMGARLGSFSDYVTQSLYHPRFDLFMILMRWSKVFGEGSLSAGVICEETSGPLLFDDFMARIDHPDLPVARPDKLFNPSPSWAEVELLRRLAILLKPRGRRFATEELQRMKALARKRVKIDGLDLDARLKLDGEDLARVAERFEAGNRRVAEDFISTPAQRAALMFGEAGKAAQAAPIDEAYFSAAADDLAAAYDGGRPAKTPIGAQPKTQARQRPAKAGKAQSGKG
jgi:hypothetical protein